ncbi:MAG: hypothetical protein ACI8XO_000313 [Verrucomicrobiales bacterium]|jgi:hypothetical protein
MKKLILILNDLPEVGKSSFSRVFEQFMSRKKIGYLPVSTTESSLGHPTYWNLEDELEAGHLISFLDQTDVTVIDIATGDGATLAEFFHEQEIFDLLVEMEAELTIVVPVPNHVGISDEVVAIGESFADNADYLIIRTPVEFDEAGDSSWVGTYGEKVMNYMGAHIVEAPEMDVTMLNEIEKNHELGLAEALANRSDLPRYLRDSLHSWELDFSESLAGAPELFIPSEFSSKSVYGSSLDSLAKG